MGDLGEIFDLFSQGDEKKSRKAQGGESQGTTSETDPKSLIINKLKQNKGLHISLNYCWRSGNRYNYLFP
jgi:hypothetical protein